jgi:hypothetical protein
MKKIKRAALFALIAIIVFFSVKFINYYNFKKDVHLIEKSSLGNYMELYVLKNKQVPESLESLLSFIKIGDEALYKKMQSMNFQYHKNKENRFMLYLKGFDRKDDSLKKTYAIQKMGFLESLRVKGDVVPDIIHQFNLNANTIYKVGNTSLVETEKFSLLKMYQTYFKCEKIRQILDYSDRHRLKVRIENNKIEYDNDFSEETFSEETLKTIDEELQQKLNSLDSNEVYILRIRAYNIESFECIPAPASL